MRFLSIYKTTERGVPQSQEEMTRMGQLVEEGMKAGYLLAVEGCMPSATGARVRLSNGKVTVTDGPFTEAKEVIGGLAIMQADSKEQGWSTCVSSCLLPVMASASFASSMKPRRRRRNRP